MPIWTTKATADLTLHLAINASTQEEADRLLAEFLADLSDSDIRNYAKDATFRVDENDYDQLEKVIPEEERDYEVPPNTVTLL